MRDIYAGKQSEFDTMLDVVFKFYGADWAAMIFTFAQLHLLGSKKPTGFVFGLLANVSWTIFGIMAGSIANPLANLVFFVMNLRGLYKWHRS